MNGYKNKKILITGGLGFIGSNLAHRLSKIDCQITLVDSLIPIYGGNLENIVGIEDRVKVNICDVRDIHAMEYLLRNQDFLFNLAGQSSHLDSMENPVDDLEINTTAQLRILEACKKVNRNIKIVFASTRQIYGRPIYLPVDENHPIKPVDINGINKVSGENYHLLYHDIYGIKACALRLTNTYGPRMRVKDSRQTFLGIWIKSILEKNPFTIFGTGKQMRDFNYVDDCVNALLHAGVKQISNGKVYNLGSEEVINLQDLAEMLISFEYGGSYKLVPFPQDRKKIDIGNYYSNFDRINSELGWSPKTDLSTGLKKTLDFYKNQGHHYW